MNNTKQQINFLKENIANDNFGNLDLEKIERQLELFENGVKIPVLVKPCLLNDGIVKISTEQFDKLFLNHKVAADDGRLTKFVPASGAASRMFQKLQSVIKRFNDFTLQDLKNKIADDKDCKTVYEFLTNINKFAFYDELKSILNVDDNRMEELISSVPKKIINAVLFHPGLNYSSKPKGAIRFHKYAKQKRTAFEEQIYEAINYTSDKFDTIKIHFTISEEHSALFEEIINKVKQTLKSEIKLDIKYSYQKKSTDTIAVNEKNEILFDAKNKIIFRPGGHGALLENLNDLDADIVVIKNIDNLIVEKLSADTILYKKLLIGYLIQLQKQVFKFIDILNQDNFNQITFDEMVDFIKDKLFISAPDDFNKWNYEQKKKFVFNKLNQPIRVCGMVKNEGEPGGGPFWVKNDDGSTSLQIVEQAQINMNDELQKNIFLKSTHFNPVDLVCGIKDYNGKKFNLHKFVDHNSGIITKKSKDGIELKALELPGLWNGSMADWITIFVEVPMTTFNPVKEVNDLLRNEHQNID